MTRPYRTKRIREAEQAPKVAVFGDTVMITVSLAEARALAKLIERKESKRFA